ncbi:transcription elongation factor grea [hydrocarbon metagenome]|uniref:Transcription elongation factor grea n=1 Tax=hydrocarbon metagenome TaxID=938273 RepID=A0A0W8E3B4_9ZZZZ
MKQIVLSPHTFDGLLKHLVDVEERQNQIIEEFSLKATEEYREYTNIFKNYLNQLRGLVERSNINDGTDDSIPIITIGTLVQVINTNNRKEHAFHIVSPYYQRSSNGDVSCLSPVGRALLLRKAGEEVAVEAPGGMFRYEIQSIKYVGE